MNDTLYTISTVAEMIGVPAHTIRYWEKEFSAFLNPLRPNGGHRRYCSRDVELLRKIMAMLKEEKYSIAGARQKLQNRTADRSGFRQEDPGEDHDPVGQREHTILAV